jgi:hypothetical protein
VAAVDLIIVNWNSGEQLRNCLSSIGVSGGEGLVLRRVVVVDNGSSDGSADGLEGFPLPLTVARNVDNLGFAAACNQGAAGSAAEYLLFLNPDTRLLPGSLAMPVAFLEGSGGRGVGVVGIQLVDERGIVARSCARFPTPGRFLARMTGLDRLAPKHCPGHYMTEWDHEDSREVDQVMGAFFLVRRSVFEALGGFDERFFVYFEDVDFSLRARRAGWPSYYYSGARAYHRGGGTSEQVKAQRLRYSLGSRILYGYKHFGRWPAHLLAAGTLLLEPFSRVLAAVARRSGRDVVSTVRGYGMLWKALPSILLRARGEKER